MADRKDRLYEALAWEILAECPSGEKIGRVAEYKPGMSYSDISRADKAVRSEVDVRENPNKATRMLASRLKTIVSIDSQVSESGFAKILSDIFRVPIVLYQA